MENDDLAPADAAALVELLQRGSPAKQEDNGACTLCHRQHDTCMISDVFECDHVWNQSCILSWISQNARCPLCDTPCSQHLCSVSWDQVVNDVFSTLEIARDLKDRIAQTRCASNELTKQHPLERYKLYLSRSREMVDMIARIQSLMCEFDALSEHVADRVGGLHWNAQNMSMTFAASTSHAPYREKIRSVLYVQVWQLSLNDYIHQLTDLEQNVHQRRTLLENLESKLVSM